MAASQLGARLGKLLEDPASADMVLVCADDSTTCLAHRVILSSASAPFALLALQPPSELPGGALGFSPAPTLAGEARLSKLPRFVVRGIRGDTLRAVLRFVYTGATEVGVGNAVELLLAAEKFDLPELRAAADKLLPRLLRDDNACALLARGAE